MNPAIGYAAAMAAILSWGIVVIILKRTTTSGEYGFAFSAPVAFALLALSTAGSIQDFPGWDVLGSRTGVLILLAGLFEFPLATIMYYMAIQQADVSLVAPLTRTKIVFVALIAFLFRIEGVGIWMTLACVAGLLGAFVLMHPGGSLLRPVALRGGARGLLFALLAALFWAVGDIFTGLVLRQVATIPATILTILAGMTGYYLYLAVRGGCATAWAMPRADKFRFAAHGAFNALGYAAFFLSIRHIGITRAAVITASWTLVAFFMGLLFLKERLTWGKIVGTILIMASVFLAVCA